MGSNQWDKNYDDIIHLPHHTSTTRPRMSMRDRAAQFAPFAALTGYEDAVRETARLTEEETVLTEDMKKMLNDRLVWLKEHLEEEPVVTVTYFVPDAKKSGGSLVSASGTVLRIDEYEKTVFLSGGERISVERIRRIDGDNLWEHDLDMESNS
ncbi:MAG: hypothetical protein IJY47_00120 [Clostridia bacterium]|nr:hypothetical protein [Clostridia bacterium]